MGSCKKSESLDPENQIPERVKIPNKPKFRISQNLEKPKYRMPKFQILNIVIATPTIVPVLAGAKYNSFEFLGKVFHTHTLSFV